MKKISIGTTTVITFLLCLIGTAFAADTMTADTPALDLAKAILQSIRDGHGWITAATALVFVAAIAKRYLQPRIAWLRGTLGSLLIVFAGAYGAAALVGMAAAGVSALNLELAGTALKVAIAAAGGFSILKSLLVDILEPFIVARFAWSAPIFDVLTYFFDSVPTPTENAEAAGNAAVVAKPAEGVAGVVGQATEIK